MQCGRPADGVCPACRSRVCAECAVVSIETGEPIAICLTCSGSRAPTTGGLRPRIAPWDLFRSGASLLLVLIAAAVAFEVQRTGWPGGWRVILTVLHPSVLLGLVPLALVLGALIAGARRFLLP